MVGPVATTGVAATAGEAATGEAAIGEAATEEAATGVAVPAKTGSEALVEVEGEPDSTGGLISRLLGGIDEGAAAGAWTGVEVDAVGWVDAGAGDAAALAAGALSAGAMDAGDAAGVGAGATAG